MVIDTKVLIFDSILPRIIGIYQDEGIEQQMLTAKQLILDDTTTSDTEKIASLSLHLNKAVSRSNFGE